MISFYKFNQNRNCKCAFLVAPINLMLHKSNIKGIVDTEFRLWLSGVRETERGYGRGYD